MSVLLFLAGVLYGLVVLVVLVLVVVAVTAVRLEVEQAVAEWREERLAVLVDGVREGWSA